MFENAPDKVADALGKVGKYVNDVNKFGIKGGATVDEKANVFSNTVSLMEKVVALKNKAAEFEHIFDDLDQKYASFNFASSALPILETAPAIVRPAGAPAPPNGQHEFYTDSVKKVVEFDSHPDAALFTGVNNLNAGDFADWKKFIMRRLCHNIIEKCRSTAGIIEGCAFPAAQYGPIRTVSNVGIVSQTDTTPANAAAPFDAVDWPKYIDAISVQDSDQDNDFVKGLKDAAGLLIMKKIIPLEWWVWKPSSEGKILFSDCEKHTVRFKNGATESYENPNRLYSAMETAIKNKLNSF